MGVDVAAILAETVAGSWRPGIGDPTPAGWATVVAYALAAYACWRARERAAGEAAGGAGRRGGVAFWAALAALMALLAINKQLDLQSGLTVLGKRMAHAQGWYDGRRAIQAAFIAAVAASGVVALGVLGWWCRSDLRRRGPALVGAVFVVAFVVIRAASFHRVDRMLGRELGGLRWNWLLELGGIACVGLAARRAARAGPPVGGPCAPVEAAPIERGGHATYRYRR